MVEKAKPRIDPTAAPGAVPVHVAAAQVEGTIERGQFTRRPYFLAAIIGAAVGFDVLAFAPIDSMQRGGTAYLFVFLVALLIIGLPIVLSEFAMGRTGQRNPVGAFRYLENDYRTAWKLVGYLFIITACFLLSFYSVITGWVLRYAFGSLSGAALSDPAGFREGVSAGPDALGFHLLVLVLAGILVAPKVQKLLQWYFVASLPVILAAFTILALLAPTFGRVIRGYYEWVIPHFETMGVGGAINAFGAAIFSLTVGMAVLMTFASYTPKTTSHATNGLVLVLGSFVFAVLATLFFVGLFSATGVAHEGQGGMQILFEFVPTALAALGAKGKFLGFLFYGGIFLAALATAAALLEPAVAFLSEEKKVPRVRAVMLVVPIVYTLGIPAAFSATGLNILADVTTVLTIIGVFVVLAYTAWFTPKHRAVARLDETPRGLRIGNDIHKWIRYGLPILVIVFFVITLFGTPCLFTGDELASGVLERAFGAEFLGCHPKPMP